MRKKTEKRKFLKIRRGKKIERNVKKKKENR